jgi:hypothetical protein
MRRQSRFSSASPSSRSRHGLVTVLSSAAVALLRSSSLLLRVALVGSFAARWRSLAARGAAERGGAAAAVGPAPFVPGDEVRVAFNFVPGDEVHVAFKRSEVRSAVNCPLYVASRPSSGRPSEPRNVSVCRLRCAMRKDRAFLSAVGARSNDVSHKDLVS